ncbi:hypothetical protein ABPG72_012821 [Tetrahymena utriculariae]
MHAYYIFVDQGYYQDQLESQEYSSLIAKYLISKVFILQEIIKEEPKAPFSSKQPYTIVLLRDINIMLEQICQDVLEKIKTNGERILTSDNKAQFKTKIDEISISQSNNIGQRLVQYFDTFIQSLDDMLKQMNTEYEGLEKMLQKNESDIRRHIRIEQQLKLYSESQQQKIDESEQARNELLDNSKAMLLQIKKDNQVLNEQSQKYKQEVEKLTQKLKIYEQSDQENSSKLANYALLQERVKVLEKMNQENRRKENNSNNTSISLNNTNTQHLQTQALQSENTINKDYKSNRQTPPLTMVQPSPLKNVRKTRTPQLPNNSLNITNMSNNKNSDYLKVKIELMENSNQNFGNNLKEIKNISNTQNSYPLSLPHQDSTNGNGSGPHITKVKDLSTIYNIRSRSRNEANKTLYSHHPSTNSSINNSYNNALIGITNREGQSSVLGNPSSAQQNKRSKSYGINKLRGSITKQGNGGVGQYSNNNNNNDGSRLSNISQEYSDYLNQDIQNRSTNENFANNCTYSSIYQQSNTIQQQSQQQKI